MADAPERRLPRDAIERLVGLVRPDWTVREATPATGGVTPVSHLVLDGPAGRRKCVLKAARGDGGHPAVGDVGAEARLLAVVGEHTTIPVPDVLGVVDEHDAARTPAFLMESLPGTTLSPDEAASLPDATLRRVARRTGRWLGQLHGVDFEHVTTFGRGVHCDGSPELQGERPAGDPAQLVLRDGYGDFRDRLRDWWAEDLAGDSHLAGTRFADLADDIGATLYERLAGVPESLSPTVARLDHGWHNLLVDPVRLDDSTGFDDPTELDDRTAELVTGVLDWGTLAAFPPAYDLALVELRLAGGSWLALPEVPDRRLLVREALLDGYREERSLPAAYGIQRRCYQLDVLQTWLPTLGDDVTGRAIPENRVDEAAAGFRRLVEGLLE